MIEKIGLFAAIIMPFWNIPLIRRIVKRKSSDDVSLTWTLGIWSCFILMLPSGIISEDIVYKTYSIMNLIFFTAVVVTVVKYRRKTSNE